MRQFFLYSVIGFFFFTGSLQPLPAQEETKLIVIDRPDLSNSIDDLGNNAAVLTTFVQGLSAKDLTTAIVTDEKLLRSFTTLFKHPANVVWYTYGNKNEYFLVTFSKSNRDYAALYHKNGDLEYALSKGSETDLPEQAKKM